MIVVLIIIAYILNVFLNRWLNYIIYKKYNYSKIPTLWFFSIMATLALLLIIIVEYFNKSNWFTGKYWNKK